MTARDIKYDLHGAYYNLLNGNIVIPASTWPEPVRPEQDYTVPVYDSVPSKASFPYVRLGDWTEVDWSDKSTYGGELTFELQIVDRYQGSLAPRGPLYLVLNGVKSIIRTKDVFNDASAVSGLATREFIEYSKKGEVVDANNVNEYYLSTGGTVVPFGINGWNIITSVVDGEDSFKEMDDTFTYVYHNIRFRHLAEQLADKQYLVDDNGNNLTDDVGALLYG